MKTKNNSRKPYALILILSLLASLGASMVPFIIPTGQLNTNEYPEPPVEQLTMEVAREMIEQEWLDQLGEASFKEASADELLRAERILRRQKGRITDERLENKKDELTRLRTLLARLPDENDGKELYFEIRSLKREIMLSDPGIDFNSIILIDNPYVSGPEQTHEIISRTENTATTGGRLLVIEGTGPDARVQKLAPRGEPAAFWRPDLSFDGKKVLFCMKEKSKSSYNIYEIGIDGNNLRQITDSDYNDLDPIYSPDGGIIFSTSRCNHYLRCGGSAFRMFILARCDMNGKNIYFISANPEADFTPAFLPDGRVLYTRWEYIDKSVHRVQSLWTVNPDGTNMNVFYGNQSHWPDMLLNARPVPNTRKVIFNATGHHDIYAGPLGIVIQDEGMNYPDGVYNLTQHVPWAEVGKGPEDKPYNPEFSAPLCYMAFQTPYPVNDELILVSARKGRGFPTGYSKYDPELEWFDLYIMDYDGNMELIYKGSYNILHAQPVRARPVPRAIPSSVKWPGRMKYADQKPEWGVLYSSDVYEGTTIPRGLVKSLRILEAEPQTYGDGVRSSSREFEVFQNKGAYSMQRAHFHGETVVSFVMDDATKRIWGTVPVEEDGSVHFRVPPVTGVYFQLLDENGRALHTMRSLTHVMPGETRGCVGCHETKAVTPLPKPSIATLRPPSEITPPIWDDETVSFPRFVQPVLDRNCIGCHGGKNPEAGLDLTHRTEPGTLISWPYVSLVFGNNPSNHNEQNDLQVNLLYTVNGNRLFITGYKEWAERSIAGMIVPYHVYPNKDVKYPTHETVIPPMTAMSYKSRLVKKATSGEHHGVKVTPEEELRLVAWVDALAPYLGMEEIIAQPDIAPELYFQRPAHNGLTYPPLMRTTPIVHKAFMQDDFRTQDDRIPRDRHGNPLPSFEVKNGKRIYRIPVENRK